MILILNIKTESRIRKTKPYRLHHLEKLRLNGFDLTTFTPARSPNPQITSETVLKLQISKTCYSR